MKHLIIIMMLLASTVTINAKDNYKNPTNKENLGVVVMQYQSNSRLRIKPIYMCETLSGKHYIQIDIGAIEKKERKTLDVVLENDRVLILNLTKFYYQQHYLTTDQVVNDEVRMELWIKSIYYNNPYYDPFRDPYFWGCYLLTDEEYELIQQYNIKDIQSEGVYKIEYKNILNNLK